VNVDQARAAILTAVPDGFARTAVAYIADRCFAPGQILSLDRQPFTIDREIHFGFIDLEAGRNWAHACMCVLCNCTDEGIEIRPLSFPPKLGGERRLVVIAVGDDVPDWAILKD
jgi:hypothetical protein